MLSAHGMKSYKKQFLCQNYVILFNIFSTLLISRWANTPKPYRIKGTKTVDVAHRRVQDQPLIIDPSRDTNGGETPRVGGAAGKIRYNMRKLSELSQHLIGGKMWKEAEQVRKAETSSPFILI